MESRYFNKANIIDDNGSLVNEETIYTKEAYEYEQGVKNGCKLPATKMLTRQKEIISPTQNSRCHRGNNTSHDSRNYCNDNDDAKLHLNEHITNINDLKAPMVRKIYSPKQQPTICNDRTKKRFFKHFGSAKDTNRKTRIFAASRKVASGPAKVEGSSSSSDETQSYDSCRFISAPDPAPSIHMKVPYFRNRKRSPTNRTTRLYKKCQPK